MKNGKWILAGLVLVLALGNAQAGIDLNEVGAFLVFPGVVAAVNGGVNVETFLTFTNTSDIAINAHVAFIDGISCNECDYDVPMTGLDTETLVLVRDPVNHVTHITNLDTGQTQTCASAFGFVTVNVEDASHNVLTDNILLGEEVVVDYTNGAALSVEAVSIQGEAGNGDRTFNFDGLEYRQFPARLGADFLAPDFQGALHAHLVLFTLAFKRNFPPLTDCDVHGFDAFEAEFSAGLQFGCWTVVALQDISPEFAWPFLGSALQNNDHGWLQLDCTVLGTGPNGAPAIGGVHGAIVQYADTGAVLRRSTLPPGPAMANADAWARLLYQSGTVGDAITFQIQDPFHGGGF